MGSNLQPRAHPVLGHVPAFTRDPLGFLTHCSQSYGSVVPLRFLHIPAVLLLDPDDIERVLVTEHREFIKPAWLRTAAVRRLLGDGLVTSDGNDWRRQRHACQPAFHLRRMQRYGEAISAVAERTLSEWKPGQTRILQQEMAYLTLEIVARTLLEVEETGWTEEASAAMDILMARFAAGRNLFGMIPLPPSIAEIRAARRLDRITDFLIQKNDEQPRDETTPDMLSMLRKPVNDGGEGMTGRALREQVKTFLGAGYESSALTLCWAFLLLDDRPDIQAHLAAELQDVLQGRAPQPDDLPKLPYTQAIIQETLRMYPPLWMTGRQSEKPCEIGGVQVARGALVMTSQWAVQRMPRYFPCPEEFRPERWLNGETTGLPRYAYFPFGGGPRICIAQSFAMMESTLLLASIASRFRLEVVPGPEIRPWATMTLRPTTGITVRLAEHTFPS